MNNNIFEIKSLIPENLYLGAVYDALNNITNLNASKFVIHVKPYGNYQKLVHGPVFTITGRNISNEDNYDEIDLIRYETYKKEYFKNEPIIMIEKGNDNMEVATFGDITCSIYQKLGAKSIITDGIGRDIDKIKQLNFPVFCKNVSPVDAYQRWAYVDYQKPIFLDGKCICPGDYVFADSDGCIFVPKDMISDFLVELHHVMKKENDIRDFINSIDFTETNGDYNHIVANYVKEKGRF